jgi:hypothetical protein
MNRSWRSYINPFQQNSRQFTNYPQVTYKGKERAILGKKTEVKENNFASQHFQIPTPFKFIQ